MFKGNIILVISAYVLFLSCDSTQSSHESYRLKAEVFPLNSGEIIISDSLFKEDEIVEITAVPEEGFKFLQWQGDIEGVSRVTSVTMDSDKSVTALFANREHSLSIWIDGEGKVEETIIPGKEDNYQYGTRVRIEGIADYGWRFKEWKGGIEGSENPTVITMEKDETVYAIFEKVVDYYAPKVGNKWRFDFVSGSGGSGPNPGKNYLYGIMNWEIIRDSISTITGDSIFVVENEFEGTRYIDPEDPSLPSDTIQVKDITYFYITAHEDTVVTYSNIAHLNRGVGVSGWLAYFNDPYEIIKQPIKRYYTSSESRNRVLELNLGNEALNHYMRFKENVGLFEYVNKSGGNNRFLTSLVLIEFSNQVAK